MPTGRRDAAYQRGMLAGKCFIVLAMEMGNLVPEREQTWPGAPFIDQNIMLMNINLTKEEYKMTSEAMAAFKARFQACIGRDMTAQSGLGMPRDGR